MYICLSEKTFYPNFNQILLQQPKRGMALMSSMVLKPNPPDHFPSFTIHLKPFFQYRKTTQMVQQSNANRRAAIITVIASILIARNPSSSEQNANALDFSMTVPDQTVEEAESGIRSHAQSLLQVKTLLESESWREAQKALRKSSSFLKQDIYTIIQAKQGSERPQLRKLYSNLFNSVTKLDYAARDKDVTRVWESYDNIVVALNDILSRIV